MSGTVNVKFHIEGLRFEDASWADLKEFLDRLLPALASMDGGPELTEVLPVSVFEGSFVPVVRTPRARLQGVYRFREGPNRRWTTEQRRKAGRLYDYLESKSLRLTCGVRTLHEVKIPTGRPDWRLREWMTLEGEVRRTGGTKGRVEMGFDHHGHVHCFAGRDIAKSLAPRLYERVIVSGYAERDVQTGAIMSFSIQNYRPAPVSNFEQGLRELHALLEDDVDQIDPAAILGEL
jgi:hypothetical protein